MIYRSKETVCSITVPRDPEYLALVQDILEHPLVRSMEAYTQHKTSRVPRRGGNGKAGNGGVFHKRRILQHIGQTAQPAAQDQAHRRACAGHGADGIYRVLDHFLQGFSSVRVWLLFSSK